MHWLFQGAEEISFETFFSRALFHPDHGYYSHSIPTVGEGGDFSTSATLSPLLARALARWISSRDELLPVIEIGAGDGSLARDIHSALPFLARLRLDFHIVETSPVLRQQQQAKAPRHTQWHDRLADALTATGGRGLIYSNELVDAFPPRVFRKEESGWTELWLDESFNELWRPVETLPDSSVFASGWLEGQRVEVHESFHEELASAIPLLIEGEMLTIDYGDEVSDIYHRRPAGSLRGFFHHTLVDGPELYLRPGKQDLTCDVNFTDLKAWAGELGLETLSYQSQSEFLTPFAKGSTVDHYLLHPDGPGGAFKVLRQVRPT